MRLVLFGLILLGSAGAFAESIPAAQAHPLQLATDAFMGDYEGEIVLPAGFSMAKTAPLCAQVIALGDGLYEAHLLAALYQRVDKLAVLQGKAEGDSVVFDGTGAASNFPDTKITAVIKEGAMTGSVIDAATRAFSLKKFVRQSPTLEAKAPEGAQVVFHGGGTDYLRHPAPHPFVMNLASNLGSSAHSVAYMRTSLFAPQAGDIQLLFGSDDGIRAWLNGKEVLAKNESRGVKRGSDLVPVSVQAGWNDLLLKITQGGGEWAAIAEARAADGSPLSGCLVSPTKNTEQAVALEKNEGHILDWDMSGPYTEAGKDAPALFDVVFPAEQGGGEWKPMAKPDFCPQPCKWRVLDNGALEIAPGMGGVMGRDRLFSHKLHIEFRLPLMAKERGQARANSGVYVQGRYEIQVLDSYGLDGADNECGGIYKNAAPKVNMCFPPLQWQTYDIEFHAAKFDQTGKMVRKAVITVLHNGVPIHENLETEPTPGGIDYKLFEPCPLYLQDHGNPVWFRNIWIQELHED